MCGKEQLTGLEIKYIRKRAVCSLKKWVMLKDAVGVLYIEGEEKVGGLEWIKRFDKGVVRRWIGGERTKSLGMGCRVVSWTMSDVGVDKLETRRELGKHDIPTIVR